MSVRFNPTKSIKSAGIALVICCDAWLLLKGRVSFACFIFILAGYAMNFIFYNYIENIKEKNTYRGYMGAANTVCAVILGAAVIISIIKKEDCVLAALSSVCCMFSFCEDESDLVCLFSRHIAKCDVSSVYRVSNILIDDSDFAKEELSVSSVLGNRDYVFDLASLCHSVKNRDEAVIKETGGYFTEKIKKSASVLYKEDFNAETGYALCLFETRGGIKKIIRGNVRAVLDACPIKPDERRKIEDEAENFCREGNFVEAICTKDQSGTAEFAGLIAYKPKMSQAKELLNRLKVNLIGFTAGDSLSVPEMANEMFYGKNAVREAKNICQRSCVVGCINSDELSRFSDIRFKSAEDAVNKILKSKTGKKHIKNIEKAIIGIKVIFSAFVFMQSAFFKPLPQTGALFLWLSSILEFSLPVFSLVSGRKRRANA